MDREQMRKLMADAKTGAVMRAFEEIDPYVVATAPDSPQDLMDAWLALHKMLPSEYIEARSAAIAKAFGTEDRK